MQKILKYIWVALVCIHPIFAENSPTLTYQLKRKDGITGNSTIYAELKAENFPKNTPLNIRVVKLDDSTIDKRKVKIDELDRVIDIESGQEWTFSFGKFLAGEPFKFTLGNGSVKNTIFVIPQPIEVKDDFGHTLSVILASSNGETFRVEASGFEPFEEVEYISISEDEKLSHKVKVSADGKFSCFLSPGVIGKISGKASVQIKGKNTNNLKVKYWWGLGIFEEFRDS